MYKSINLFLESKAAYDSELMQNTNIKNAQRNKRLSGKVSLNINF